MLSLISRGLLLLAGLCCLFSGSQPQDPLEIDVDEHDHEHQEHLPCQHISYSIIQLTFILYRKSGSWTEDANILFSPVNIIAASLMLSLGAKDNTHNQILQGLKFNITEIPETYIHSCLQQLLHILHLPDHRPHLTIDSGLFTDKGLKLVDKFVNNIKEIYHTKTIAVNFKDTEKAQNQINKYVETETQGKIVDLAKDLEEDTALALMNYIVFQGNGFDEVDVEHKLEADFHVSQNETVKVPMINRRGRFFLHREEELSSWVLVNHYMGDATAFFILPDQGKMQKLEENLSQKHFINILKLVDIRTVNLYFPELYMSTTYDLKTILSTLGITQIFSNEADLSGITQDVPLKLNKAFHRTVLTFNDEVKHTTRNSSLSKRGLSKVPVIRFNRPFIIIVKDEYTNVPLFIPLANGLHASLCTYHIRISEDLDTRSDSVSPMTSVTPSENWVFTFSNENDLELVEGYIRMSSVSTTAERMAHHCPKKSLK
ncbi:alpha-1-antitrypsin-related protein-like [Phodopus roborovskii]|uniref:alpha-1-antitrypsin-related protein-like n=1 Tax=Phodopus roborovskii TaxID=109678 RepID=UPI0021E3E45F|nr:alpha-1-antitrypsin-related protein-like [Phodopus roborovskii]